MQEQVLNLLLDQEEVSWKTIIQDLVKCEQMNPWDVDITLLTQKYIEVIHNMQEHNLRISGKILLAAAFLLKMKSAYLIEHDFSYLDLLINQTNEDMEEELLSQLKQGKMAREKYQLIPRNPQPRSRKVSVQDLVEALQQAMATKKRILAAQRPVKFILPKSKMDILEVIRGLYHKIVYFTDYKQKTNLTFSELLPPQAGKREKAYTFIPLLHLENLQIVETKQEKPFDEIGVKLIRRERLTRA